MCFLWYSSLELDMFLEEATFLFIDNKIINTSPSEIMLIKATVSAATVINRLEKITD